MNPVRPDLLVAKYTLKCSEKTCPGERIVDQNIGVRWRLGDVIPQDPSNPPYGRCPQCLRHNMTVATVPPSPLPDPPKGFAKVPEE